MQECHAWHKPSFTTQMLLRWGSSPCWHLCMVPVLPLTCCMLLQVGSSTQTVCTVPAHWQEDMEVAEAVTLRLAGQGTSTSSHAQGLLAVKQTGLGASASGHVCVQDADSSAARIQAWIPDTSLGWGVSDERELGFQWAQGQGALALPTQAAQPHQRTGLQHQTSAYANYLRQ